MNIDRIQSQLVRLYGGRSQGPRGSEKAGGPSGAGEDATARGVGDGVTLSSEATSARRLASVVASAPEVRQQLVEELRGQLRAGTYQPNDEAVARALLRAE